MIDPAFVRDHLDEVRAAFRNRGLDADADLEQLATLETRRRRLIPEIEGLKREQNAAGDEVARAKRQGQDATPLFAASKARGQQIRQLEIQLDQTEHQRTALLLTLPNLPHASVPVGRSAADNKEVRRHGEPPVFDFEPKPHVDLGLDARHSRLRAGHAHERRALRGADGRRARGWRERSSTSCSTCTRASTATPRWSRRSSSTRQRCAARATCPKFEQDLLQDRRRLGPLSHSDGRGAADQPAPRGDSRRPSAAAALHRLHAVLPQRSRHRTARTCAG